MNEVTRIHLGRQPFTVSVAAHKALKAYLADIEQQVVDPEVVSEVELRMAELLAEHGVSGDKVILPEDVDYLKQQLGDPADFSDDGEPSASAKTDDQATRHLFRDTDAAMLAGVSAGIASYFGLDVVLVRILFVVLTIFSAGLGIVLYIVLWLAVPPATTTSEKLQMQGKPVTLGALKDSVSKADLSNAARRANSSALAFINSVFGVIIKLLGIGFIVAGISMVFGLVVTKVYMLLHHNQLFQENIFPVGVREHLLVDLGLGLAAIFALFLMLVGVASLRRKWPVRGWVTGILAGLFLLGLATAGAFSADVAPRIHQRYENMVHTTAVKNLPTFDKVSTTGSVDISYVSSPGYAVSLHYVDHPELSKIKIYVRDGTLHVDSTAFDAVDHCTMLCLFPKYDMVVQIAAPNIQKFDTPSGTDIFYPPQPVMPQPV
jgi:phage shock protein PspC (stress-responsive transcriptional regulator)